MANMPPSAPHATHPQLPDEDALMPAPTTMPPNEPTVDSEAVELIMRHIIEPLEVPIPNGRMADNHTRSEHTRAPILYDRHLPSNLRLRNLAFDPQMLDGFKSGVLQELLNRKPLIEFLQKDQPLIMLDLVRMQELGHIEDLQMRDEGSVSNIVVSKLVTNVALRYATLALFDLTPGEMQLPDSVFEAEGVVERETKADFMVSTRARAPISQRDFFGGELKNLLAGDPRVFLSMLLLIAAQIGHPEELFPWPSLACHQKDGKCGFPESHRQLDLAADEQSAPPPDSKSAPPPSSDLVKEQTQRIQTAIAAVVAYIPIWDKLYEGKRIKKTGIVRASRSAPLSDLATTDAQITFNKDKEILETTKALITKLFDKYSIPVEYRAAINGWLKNAIYVTIQAWCQMVRHNTTLHLVSTYQISWIIRRHRETRTATFSPFFHPQGDKTFLAVIGAIIFAFHDAQLRAKENPDFQWKDPYAQQNQAEQKLKTKPTTKTGKRDREQDPDSGENQRDGQDDEGPHDPNMEPHNDSDDPSAPKKRRTDGGDKPSPNDAIDLQQLHLAFQTNTLWSDGFSVLQRIEQHRESSPDQPTLPFPRSQLFPESLAPPDLNIRERRPSADSLVGTASVSAASPTAPIFPAVISKAGIFLDTKVATGAVGTVWSG
ncbi:hypothetical protein C8R43DRAFT_706888 [Mycena crocata]|nr:hypothetical protein C8R43DRAFT_706888 [Mycena crocata]